MPTLKELHKLAKSYGIATSRYGTPILKRNLVKVIQKEALLRPLSYKFQKTIKRGDIIKLWQENIYAVVDRKPAYSHVRVKMLEKIPMYLKQECGWSYPSVKMKKELSSEQIKIFKNTHLIVNLPIYYIDNLYIRDGKIDRGRTHNNSA